MSQLTPRCSRKKKLDLPPFLDSSNSRMKSETENKLKEIMSGSGILKIGGQQYKTDSKELIDVGELGSGTSGHVVKMRHQITGTTIAVKVSSSFGDTRHKLIILISPANAAHWKY